MSKSRRTPQPMEADTPHQKANIFMTPTGGLRTLWLLVASLLCYALVSLALRQGFTAAFAAVFKAWGIDAENAGRAPAWARVVYTWHGSAVTAVVSAALVALSAWLKRLWSGIRTSSPASGHGFACASLEGLSVALIIAVLCLLPDSMRLVWPLNAPRLTWSLPVLCAVSLMATLAEEMFLKCVLFDGLKRRWGAAWATALHCLLFFVSYGGYAGNILSGINVMLLGGLGCAIYTVKGFWASVGFRWSWSVATVFLLGFGGAEASVYRLYGVSEAIMTGGDAGPIYGLWASIAFAALIMWLERDKLSSLRHLKWK